MKRDWISRTSRYRSPEELADITRARLLARIEVGGEPTWSGTSCWRWLGYIDEHGYAGQMSYLSKPRKAHRLAYELFREPIPAHHELDHLCLNPACVNPDHLEPVPGYVNLARSNALSAQRARQTHCKRGHKFTSKNTRRSARGERICRSCRAARQYALRHGLDFEMVVRDRQAGVQS